MPSAMWSVEQSNPAHGLTVKTPHNTVRGEHVAERLSHREPPQMFRAVVTASPRPLRHSPLACQVPKAPRRVVFQGLHFPLVSQNSDQMPLKLS